MTAQLKTMLKRLLLVCVLGSFLAMSTWALAQETETETQTGTGSAVDAKKVQALKEKLATKVAELRQNQKRGYFGSIAALDKTSFTLVTANGEVQVKFTEDTLLFKVGRTKTEATSKDLKNGSFASVLGFFDEESKQHTAKAILLQSQINFVSGEVTVIDKSKGTLTIKTPANKEMKVEYEKTTLADEVTESKKIAKSGLSRFVVGDKVHVWGLIDEEDASVISANKILRISKSLLAPVVEEAHDEISSSPEATPKASARPRVSPTPRPTASPRSSPRTRPRATPEATPEP